MVVFHIDEKMQAIRQELKQSKRQSIIFSHLLTKKKNFALTHVAQLFGRRTTGGKVADLIPGQGTCLGFGFSP